MVTNPEALLTGLKLGYNYQRDKMVYGVEVDSTFANIHGSGLVNTRAILPTANYTSTADQQIKWFSTLRGRIGFTAMDNLLLYGTGGLAVGSLDYSANVHRSAIVLNHDIPASANVTKIGWTIGAGAEYALPDRWSVKAEYLYYDLGSESITGNLTIAGFPTPTQLTYSFATRGSIVRFGLNYKIRQRAAAWARHNSQAA